MALPVSAQQRRISGTVSDDIDVVIGANVKEIDKNNRIVSQAITDMNGNFTMNIKNPNNTLEVTYMGYKKWSQKIGNRSVVPVKMQENTKTIQEVTVTGKKLLTKLTISPDAVDPDDVEMLQDMIIAAVNEAINLAESESDELMRGISSGLNLPF